MDLETLNRFWRKACELTAGLEPSGPLSTPQLVDHINRHLPPGLERVTKTKVHYLLSNKILNPQIHGGGSERKSWRYGIQDIRRVLLVELLKAEGDLSVKEIKGWMQSLSDSLGVASDVPAPARNAYPLLRNRAIGALVTALGGHLEEAIPPGCLIALRLLEHGAESWRPDSVSSWEEASQVFNEKGWSLAAAHPSQKLFLYADWKQLLETQFEMENPLPKYQWHALMLEDGGRHFYGLRLGIPDRESYHPVIKGILGKSENPTGNSQSIQLREYPGLATLLKASFMTSLEQSKGTPLSTLAEIVARVSDVLDYAAVLAPDSQGRLIVKECSSKFPDKHRGKALENDGFLFEWCYTYGQEVFVETFVEGDPRIPRYGRNRPQAVAAVPAVTKERGREKGESRKFAGVLYAARSEPLSGKEPLFPAELKAGLKALGHICGDIIARDQVERDTIEEVSRLFIASPTPAQDFQDLGDLLMGVGNLVREGVSPERTARSWVYLLTLNVQILASQLDASQKNVHEWICRQAAEVTKDFLGNKMFKHPVRIGVCEVEAGKFVFAVLRILDFAETKYKEGLSNLSKQLKQMSIKGMPVRFYPRHITFRYEQLRRDFTDSQPDGSRLSEYLEKIVVESLNSSPNIVRGGEALRTSKFDLAISEYQNALLYAPHNDYAYKHLAEACWLKGDVDRAIEYCRKALHLNPRYASARCLLADCLSHQGRLEEAFEEYEETLKTNGIRPDFLTRYGIALAGMTPSQYQGAQERLRLTRPDLAARNFQPQPYLEAIAIFETALRYSEEKVAGSEHEIMDRAKYHCHKGYAYLQAYLHDRNPDLLDEALENFTLARSLTPEDLQLMQVYRYAIQFRDGQQPELPSKSDRVTPGNAVW